MAVTATTTDGPARRPRRVAFGWTQRADLSDGVRETGDPLGIRAAAARSAADLVPVITASCDSTRLFSLICLLLAAARAVAPSREQFLSLEHLWLLAYVRDNPHGADSLFAGVTVARNQLDSNLDTLDLEVPLLGNQLRSGLWGRMRRPSSQLGLIDGSAGGPQGWRVTPDLGREIEVAARDALCAKHAKLLIPRHEIPRHSLARVFRLGATASSAEPAELDVLGRALGAWDAGHGGEFARLHRLHQSSAASRALTLDAGDNGLTTQQQRAHRTLVTLDRLACTVEDQYRQWLRCEESDPVDLAVVAGKQAQEALQDAGELELAQFCRRLETKPTMQTVHLHHIDLARRRGRQPWTKPAVAAREVSIPPFAPLETRLRSISRLFEEGVDPHG